LWLINTGGEMMLMFVSDHPSSSKDASVKDQRFKQKTRAIPAG
jgi:hypothetical protein